MKDKNRKAMYADKKNVDNVNAVINHEIPNIQNNAGQIKVREERYMKKGIHYSQEDLLRAIEGSVTRIREAKSK